MPAVKVASFKPNRRCVIYINKDSMLDHAFKTAMRRYNKVLSYNKRCLIADMECIYGKDTILINDKHVAEVKDRFLKFKEKIDIPIATLKSVIDEYVGEECCFFRSIGEKRIPIPLSTIYHIYEMVKKKEDKEKIKSLLKTTV